MENNSELENKADKPRSLQQNSSYYGWLRALSDELVNKGVDMKEMIVFEIMATPDLIHKNITHRLIKKWYDKESTADLTTKEMSEIVEVIRQGFIKKTNGEVDVPFVPTFDYDQYTQQKSNQEAIKNY